MNHSRDLVSDLAIGADLETYIPFLTIVLACDVKDDIRKKIVDAYFLHAVTLDAFADQNVTKLESADNMVNLLIADDYENFYDDKPIGTEHETR